MDERKSRELYGFDGGWSWEAEPLEHYTQLGGLGRELGEILPRIFAYCVSLIFATGLVKDIVSIIALTTLLFVPHNRSVFSGKGCYQYDARSGRGKIVSLPFLGKLLLLVVIAVRMELIIGLARWGVALSIVNTTELADVVLNC